MTIAQELESQQGIPGDVIFPPGDLYSDEPPLETELHLRQIILFLKCLEWLWRDRNDFYAAGSLTIYYSPRQLKSEYFRGPDFFVVLGTQRKTRKSWVVWEEDGKYPHVILEILSDSTAKTDKGLKKEIYQETFRTFDYFWFDPYTLEFAGFHFCNTSYQGIAQRIFLESKALELLALQLDQLAAAEGNNLLIPRLKPRDVEQIYQAREILLTQWLEPPSVCELAQQVKCDRNYK
ncbi:Uma2 family endonuclease [Nostoc sp.]|uniref:Uma2 family endonuclease n=1 Tax=Nostoc sp. TaxID=1180 RepID=UPI002FF5802B